MKFEFEFAQIKKEITSKKEVPSSTGKISLLLPLRQQTITIVLNKIKKSPVDIVEALLRYDDKVLTPETCEILNVTMPTQDELERLKELDNVHQDEFIDTVADCDNYLYLIINSALYPDLRLKSMIFKHTYKSEIIDILRLIEKVLKAFEYVKKNEELHKWLEIILAYGNYLNGNSNRGGAWGFRLDALAKLNEVKASDGKKTLMMHIVEYIGDVLKEHKLFEVCTFIEKNFPVGGNKLLI